jgi:GT2 family glycosyltransferase
MAMPIDGFATQSLTTIDQPLPPGAAGRWCSVSLRLPAGGSHWWAQLELTDEARGQVVRDCFLRKPRPAGRGWGRGTLVHVPNQATRVLVRIYGGDASEAVLLVRRCSRVGTALRLLWQGRRLIARSLAGDARGRLGRLRAVLGQAPARAGDAPPYAAWIDLCEAAMPPPGKVPALECALAILAAGVDADRSGLQATLESLRRQTRPGPEPLLISAAADWARVAAPWVVMIQAGEILSPDALAWFADAAAAHPACRFITADCDYLTAQGARADPLFKPGPDGVLLRSGLLAAGACAVRFSVAEFDVPLHADAARRALAIRHEGAIVRVPRILTHIGAAAAPAPPSAVAVCRAAGFTPGVTAIVPSAARSPHVAHCLRRVVTGTDYPAFAVDVVISDMAHADPSLLRRIGALPRLHISEADLPSFNYAAVNNQAAARANGEFLLLLNDDVAPVEADWLGAMVAHMQDPGVGIVGARLLYGNGMVQHEGVVMGLAHLCEHAGRLRDGNDPGPHGLALLDREVSAVTGACLLIRADLYRALGGMDESFAIALNDVDLCLRARRAGWRVVYCAQATLWHYESLSLGRHYAGDRAGLEAREVRRLRALWPEVIAADPFYNPSASLEPGREWQPAFPPRAPGVAAGAANNAATGC